MPNQHYDQALWEGLGLLQVVAGGVVSLLSGSTVIVLPLLYILAPLPVSDPPVPNYPPPPIPDPPPPPPPVDPSWTYQSGCGTYLNKIYYYRTLTDCLWVRARYMGYYIDPGSSERFDAWECEYADCAGNIHPWRTNSGYPVGGGQTIGFYRGYDDTTCPFELVGPRCPCQRSPWVTGSGMACTCAEIQLIVRQELQAYLECVRNKICSSRGQRVEVLGRFRDSGRVSVALQPGESVNFILATVLTNPLPPNISSKYGSPNQFRLGELALGGMSALAATHQFEFLQQFFTVFPNPCSSVYWRFEQGLLVELQAYISTAPTVN